MLQERLNLHELVVVFLAVSLPEEGLAELNRSGQRVLPPHEEKVAEGHEAVKLSLREEREGEKGEGALPSNLSGEERGAELLLQGEQRLPAKEEEEDRSFVPLEGLDQARVVTPIGEEKDLEGISVGWRVEAEGLEKPRQGSFRISLHLSGVLVQA